MATVTTLVGHAPCPHCQERSEVRRNKRGKLLLSCPVHSQFPYQTIQGQKDLQKITVFLPEFESEYATAGAASSGSGTGADESVSPVQEPTPEPEPEPEKKRRLFGRFGGKKS